MEEAVAVAIRDDGLHAHQVLLPEAVSPRLDTGILPVRDITDRSFIKAIVGQRFLDTTNRSAAKLLQTSMRHARI